MVLFDLLSPSVRSPGVYTEIAPARSTATLAVKVCRALLIGQKRSGSVPALTPTRIYSPEQARSAFGAGSQLSEMLAAWFTNNRSTEVWAIAVADAGGAVAEVRTLTVGGTVTAAGVLAVYFGGHRVAIAVASGEASATTATNLNAAIAADPDVPFTATVLGAVVTITAKNAGTLGSDISVGVNFAPNESFPPGLTLAQAVTTPGAGVVSYSTSALFGLIANDWFDILSVGANDATNLTYVTNELRDRWHPERAIEGTVYTGFFGDLADSLAQGALLNSEFSGQMPAKNAPQPPWVWGAALAAQVAIEAARDPARGFRTVPLLGIMPPASADRFMHTEQEQLLKAGMSTYRVTADGQVQIDRLISNYRLTAAGAPDTTYLALNTVLTTAYMRYDWRTSWEAKYPRHKVADDNTAFAPGQPIVTPERGKAEAAVWGRKMESAGLLERFDDFIAGVVCQRNANDPTRLDFLLPVNLVNQLEVVGTRLEFTV